MIFCSRAYEHIYVTSFKGDIKPCSWTKIKLGNLFEEDLSSIWMGEKAKQFRASIEDGSFIYCNTDACPFYSNNTLPDLTEADYKAEVDKRLKEYPVSFNLAYDYVCNHACPSCRNTVFVPDSDYKQRMKDIQSFLLPYLVNAKDISASGRGELFASVHMLDMLSQLRPKNPDCSFKFETNGVLLKERWHKIKHLEPFNISVTVTSNSYEKSTFKKINGGFDNLDKMIGSLEYTKQLKEDSRINRLHITMVVQDLNFREIPEFVRKSLNEFNADRVTLRPIYKWFQITEQNYWIKNLLNPLNPYHDEYLEVMSHPSLKDPRVYNWQGDNFLRKAVPQPEI